MSYIISYITCKNIEGNSILYIYDFGDKKGFLYNDDFKIFKILKKHFKDNIFTETCELYEGPIPMNIVCIEKHNCSYTHDMYMTASYNIKIIQEPVTPILQLEVLQQQQPFQQQQPKQQQQQQHQPKQQQQQQQQHQPKQQQQQQHQQEQHQPKQQQQQQQQHQQHQQHQPKQQQKQQKQQSLPLPEQPEQDFISDKADKTDRTVKAVKPRRTSTST